MRYPAWVNVISGVPTVSSFTTTQGMGSPIVIDQNTDIAYYLATGDVVSELAGGSGGGGAILAIDGGDASNTGDPYLELDGGTA